MKVLDERSYHWLQIKCTTKNPRDYLFNFCREKGPETVPLKTIDNVKKVLQTNYDSPTSFLQVKVFIYHVIYLGSGKGSLKVRLEGGPSVSVLSLKITN